MTKEEEIENAGRIAGMNEEIKIREQGGKNDDRKDETKGFALS